MKKQEERKLPVNINFVIKKFDPYKLTSIPPSFVQAGLHYVYLDDACFDLHSILDRRGKHQSLLSHQRLRSPYRPRVAQQIPRYPRHVVPIMPEQGYAARSGPFYSSLQRPFPQTPFFGYNRMMTTYNPRPTHDNWINSTPSFYTPGAYFPPVSYPGYDGGFTSYRPVERLQLGNPHRGGEEPAKDVGFFPSKLVDPTRVVFSALCSEKRTSGLNSANPNCSSFREPVQTRSFGNNSQNTPGILADPSESSEAYSSDIKPS